MQNNVGRKDNRNYTDKRNYDLSKIVTEWIYSSVISQFSKEVNFSLALDTESTVF